MQLKEIRDRISSIDAEMAELFVKRMEAVREVAAYKGERGLAIEDPERERELIISRSAAINDEELRMLYVSFLQSTMDISKQLQQRMLRGLSVACTGDEDSAGHNAAKTIFSDGNIRLYGDCKSAYKAAESGECDLVVLPLENSYKGEIGKVYDLIFSGSLYVNEVYAVEYDRSTTRYAVLSRIQHQPAESAEKKNEALLMMFTVGDEVGGLAKAINIISAYDFNMRVMRSRPMKDIPWHYYFYAELVGDCSRENADRLVRALKTACPVVKIAGHFFENRNDPANA